VPTDGALQAAPVDSHGVVVSCARGPLHLGHSRHTTPVDATPPTNLPLLPSLPLSVGAGQGLFFVLASVGVRIRYLEAWWCWRIVVLMLGGDRRFSNLVGSRS